MADLKLAANDLQVLKQAIGDLDDEKVFELLEEFMAAEPSADEVHDVVNACQQGMAIVSELFDKEEYFVGDLIFAGELLEKAIDILKPAMENGEAEKSGVIVLGTVEGDLHDIGKNIFKSMAQAAGFEVHDLGVDQSPEDFIEKAKEVKPQIIGMSGVLTLALDSMKKIVDALQEAGLRKDVKIIIGGNPVTEDACKKIGADAFTTNAGEGVNLCQGWMS